MIKKILLQILASILMVFTVISVFIITIIYVNRDKSEKSEKLYEISTITHDDLIQTIAHYLVKPILESALDSYIERHVLAEYLEEIKQQKEEEKTINFYEITEGDGSKALCGQEVILQIYKISNNLSTLLPTDITLKIGHDFLKEVNLGIIGMKEGGERIVNVGNNSYYLRLVEVKNKYPNSVNNMLIFNDLINKYGKQVECGNEISVQYSVRKHNGEYIVKDQVAQFKVGERQAPLAIELGVIGMRSGNKRTILSSSDLLTGALMKDVDTDILIIELGLNPILK